MLREAQEIKRSRKDGYRELESKLSLITEFEVQHSPALREGQDHIPLHHIIRLFSGLFEREIMKRQPHEALITECQCKFFKKLTEKTVAPLIIIKYKNMSAGEDSPKLDTPPGWITTHWNAVLTDSLGESMVEFSFELVSRPLRKQKYALPRDDRSPVSKISPEV